MARIYIPAAVSGFSHFFLKLSFYIYPLSLIGDVILNIPYWAGDSSLSIYPYGIFICISLTIYLFIRGHPIRLGIRHFLSIHMAHLYVYL